MQISATSAATATSLVDRQATQAQPGADQKAAEPAKQTPKVFTPAPPLRPNIQDYVDINRTLIALRKL